MSKQFLFIIAISTIIWNQQIDYFDHKITIENAYRDIIISAVSHILTSEKFVVVVNVELSTSSGAKNKISIPSDEGYFVNNIEIYIMLDETLATNIVKQKIPYDAILLGSGDKATPINGDTTDKFFMIKDKYIRTQKFFSTPSGLPYELTDLYDYTNDPFNGYPTLSPTQELKLVDASLKSGWFYDLEQPGEKNTAKAIVINNVVYFTSYTPSSASSCSAASRYHLSASL